MPSGRRSLPSCSAAKTCRSDCARFVSISSQSYPRDGRTRVTGAATTMMIIPTTMIPTTMISTTMISNAAGSHQPLARPRATPGTGTGQTQDAAPCTSQLASLSTLPWVSPFLNSTLSVTRIDQLPQISLSCPVHLSGAAIVFLSLPSETHTPTLSSLSSFWEQCSPHL